MDCHVFRRLCDELAPALMGCRIEKIHRPAKDVTLFTLYGTVGKRFLFFRAGRKAPFLFLSTHKIPVGSAPPADIMRLRKYLADRRIIDVLPDWVGRRLYLHVNADTECWLTLDLREGPSLLFDTPPEPEIPAWPDPAHWAEACEGDGWRNWPVITPPLRRTLPLLPPDEQAALLLDLEAGGGDPSAVNRILNQEIREAVRAGLNVLYCIGETSEEQPRWQEVLKEQLDEGLKDTDRTKVTIAYEPVWAIGPGKTPPDSDYIGKIGAFVKETTGGMDVVYGGGLKQAVCV